MAERASLCGGVGMFIILEQPGHKTKAITLSSVAALEYYRVSRVLRDQQLALQTHNSLPSRIFKAPQCLIPIDLHKSHVLSSF